MKSRAMLQIKFTGGTDIKDAVAEAKAKAEQLDVAYITFDFNGKSFSIGRNADTEKAVEQYCENNERYIVIA